jgi:hypothetical protein
MIAFVEYLTGLVQNMPPSYSLRLEHILIYDSFPTQFETEKFMTLGYGHSKLKYEFSLQHVFA